MMIAVAVSVVLHAALLTVRFVAPDAFKLQPADPGLEVILVNAKHDRKPIKAEALAQANLDGGGQADAGRSKSPLPDMRKSENGDSVKAMQRKIAELEQVQQNLLTKARAEAYKAPPVTEKDKPDPARTGQDMLESSKAIARQVAEISTKIEDQNKRPRKTYLMPSTQEVGYAMYYKTMQKRIEEIGTLNFPQKDGRKLYGELELEIPVFQDGTIYVKDGGVKVTRAPATRRSTRRPWPSCAAPRPSANSRRICSRQDKDDLWVIITRFKFTREERLETNSKGN